MGEGCPSGGGRGVEVDREGGGGGFFLNIGTYSFFLLFSLMKRHVLGVYTQYTV